MVNICHLIRFTLQPLSEISIDKNFLIRKLQPFEIEIMEKVYRGHENFFNELRYFQFCIEDKEMKDFAEFSKILEKLFMAIWLFCGNAVTEGALVHYNPKNLPSYSASFGPYKCWGATWQATGKQMEKLGQFWSEFKKFPFDLSDIGIRYFKETMFSEKAEDRLLKLTISMERILLPKENHELRDKFSTRAALLLTNELKERKEIKKFFRDMYDLRSRIVHGEKAKKEKTDYFKYFYYCRKIICLFLENQSDWNTKLENISLGENKLIYTLSEYIEEKTQSA